MDVVPVELVVVGVLSVEVDVVSLEVVLVVVLC